LIDIHTHHQWVIHEQSCTISSYMGLWYLGLPYRKYDVVLGIVLGDSGVPYLRTGFQT